MIKQIHNSLAVDDNSRALKFDNFSEFQNVMSDSPPPPPFPAPSPSVIMTHCIRKSICDSPLKGKSLKIIEETAKFREMILRFK